MRRIIAGVVVFGLFGAYMDKVNERNKRNSDGSTSLHLAVLNGDEDAVKNLLNLDDVPVQIFSKADVHARDNDGNTIYYYLILYCLHPLMKLYLQNPATIHTARAKAGDNFVPSMKVAKDKTLKLMDLLIKAKADIEIKDNTGATPLILLAKMARLTETNSMVDMAKAFIAAGAKINAINNTDDTAVAYAAEHGAIKLVNLLIDKKADFDTRNKAGNSPLALAAANDSPDFHNATTATAAVLIRAKANFESRNNNGLTVLSWAALSGNSALVRMLVGLEAKIDAPCKFDGADNVTPIALAAWKGDANCVRILINARCGIDFKDSKGRAPLDMARDQRHSEVMQLLKEEKSKLIAMQNAKKADGNEAVVQLQLQFNAAQLLLQQQSVVLQRVIATAGILHHTVEQGDVVGNARLEMKTLLADIKQQLITVKDDQQRGLQKLNDGQNAAQATLVQMKMGVDEQRQQLHNISGQNKATHKKIDGVDAKIDDAHDTVKQGIVDQRQRERDALHSAKTQKQNSATKHGDAALIALQRAQMQPEPRPGSVTAATAGMTHGRTPSYGTG